MEQKFIIDDKIINSAFRRSEFKFIFFYNNIISLLLLVVINIFFYYFATPNASEAYINLFKNHDFFNFIYTSIIFFLASNIYAYYLFIEAKIQFKNRKFYFTGVDKEDKIKNIFTFPLSFSFSILLSIFFTSSIKFYIQQVDPAFNPHNFSFAIFIFVFILIGFLMFLYYYKGIKFILFRLLSLSYKITSNYIKKINDEITNSKLNNINLCLVNIKIKNIYEVAKKLKKSKKNTIKAIIRDLNKKIRDSDYIIVLNYNNNLIGYILNSDEKVVKTIMEDKIKPYMANKIIINDKIINLIIDYNIEDLLKNEDINSVKDIIKLSKK